MGEMGREQKKKKKMVGELETIIKNRDSGR